MPDQPKSIVYLRPDTFGDLVIFSSALQQLLSAWPDAQHTIVVREGYQSLAPLFPAQLNWKVAPLNPFKEKPSECREALTALLRDLEQLAPDVIVAGTVNRTWLEAAVAAHFFQARRVALGDRAVDPLFAMALQLELGIEAQNAFPEIVAINDGSRDWENNHRLADHLVGRALPRLAPTLAVPKDCLERADRTLRENNLPKQGWAAVFAAGLANVPIKAWPEERFADVVVWLQREKKLPVMLLGHTSEQELLDRVAHRVVALGGEKPAVWLGRDGKITQLAALLSTARIYVGHDTGAMHIAAAVGRPVVGIFGGGHWPRFRPVGRQTVSIVQPMPCFGCNWDCQFGDAPCVKTLRVADVQSGVNKALDANEEPLDLVVEASNLSEQTLQFIAAVTPRYRALQNDRLDRQHRIEELKSETNLKDDEIGSLKREADVKDVEISSLKREANTKDDEIASLKREADTKDREISSLKQESNVKDDEIASLKSETDTKDAEIAQLKKEADGKDAEIASIKAIANEREQLIFSQSKHIKNFQQIVAELNAALGTANERERENAPKLERLKHLEWIFSQIPDDPSKLAELWEARAVHVRNIEALVTIREREIAELKTLLTERDRSVANYAAGLTALEGSKHYAKLLAEKEAVIQSLHKACTERETVIKQLALDASGPGSRVAKLWTATCAHLRLKLWQPFNEWLFKKIVEEYWMQIGILRHYEPRPVTWDAIPKPRLPIEKLPQIGLVTPSYGQAPFIESTILSVVNQNYPRLRYVVQDGGSQDNSPQIIARYADRLAHWESVRDRGQADAVRKGFAHIESKLAPDDVMGWLNSDDLLAPRSLRHVGEFFAMHPEVDVVYGHRIIIDTEDRDVGRWIMPRHDPRSLEWIDYVPQETLFWRKRAWDLVGGIDTSFQFALDWDLLARFTQAKLRVVRLPYFLGCFRVHPTQKTSAAIHTTGAEEMVRVRTRFHGPERQADFAQINAWARRVRFRGALNARLHSLGVRW